MKILAAMKRPEYVFRPAQILRRLRFQLRAPRPGYRSVQLPWGLPIRVEPGEEMGSAICRAGVYELAICECISRLVDPGDLAVDAGANIGQMTSIMALRAGPRGKVVAVEPHPAIFADLQHNIAIWKKSTAVAPVEARNSALSNRDGAADLLVPSNFQANRGVAFLEGSLPKHGSERLQVAIERLDSLVEPGEKVGFLKIDVEGHQLEVAQGAERLLASGSIRDIVFEESARPDRPHAYFPGQGSAPQGLSEYLEALGYTVFAVEELLMGPAIRTHQECAVPAMDIPLNYLATVDPGRLVARMSRRGWTVFNGK